ncbi:MAG: carbohydrate ABC transporter permease [Clostridiales bacterium]|nr:carbohydrate ABC transporter permease [Clostridiales bacterium]
MRTIKRSNAIRKSTGEKIFNVCNTIFMFALCLVMLYPVYYVLVLSLNEGTDSMKGGIWFWPRAFTMFNYQYVLSNGLLQNSYMITIGRTVLGTVLGLAVNALAAYTLSERNIPFKKVMMTFVLIPMLFNGGQIPYFLQLRNLRLYNTFWVFVIPGLVNVWNIFVMKRFFQDIPDSLRESARIDGATHMQTLVKIILPLSLPMLASLGLFTAVGHWNDWFSGAFYVQTNDLMPVQTYLQKLLTANNISMVKTNNALNAEAAFRESQTARMTATSVKMAAVMVGTLPILCVYPFLQKYFVKGMLTGSVKG